MIYGFSQVAARSIARLFWGLRVVDLHKVPAEGGCLLACSHESYLDPALVGAVVRRRIRYLARRSLFERDDGREKPLGKLLRIYGAVPLSREGTAVEGIRVSLEQIAAGYPLIMFPEGTRSPDGSLQEFKAGVGLLALRSGAPVVPMSLSGSVHVWPRGRKLPRLFGGPIVIRFGDPVTYAKPTKAQAVAADLRDRILALRPEAPHDGGAPEEATGERSPEGGATRET